MPTTGIVPGNLMKMSFGSEPPVTITCITQANMSFTTEMRDTTCIDDGDYNNEAPARLSWEAGGTALFAYDSANGWAALWAAWKGKTKGKVRFGSLVSGDKRYGGDCYITNLDLQNPGANDNVNFTFSLKGVGEPLETTNP